MPRSLAKFLAFCLFFSSLAVALSENALGRTFGRPAQQPAQAPRDAGAKADDERESRLLELGKPIKRELAGGDSHTYRIRLAADQFLKVVIEQDGIDVVARLQGTDGKQIMEFDSERRLRGQETAPLVAEAEGDYRLVVQPGQKAAPTGAYEIRIEELRAATENDRALQEARKLYKKASDLSGAGKYDEALPYFEGALEIRERRLGPDHSDVSQAINGLAAIHYYKGEYSKAAPLYQRALAIREKSLGPEHPDVAASLNSLASIYDDLGAYAKAEPLHQRALAVREKSLGPEHPDVAASLNNLAVLYRNMGAYAKAEPLYQRALAVREKSLGPEHPDVAASLNNLASLYRNMGDYAKAEPLYQRALAIQEKSLGPEHLNVAGSLNNLAILYSNLGDYAKAEPLHQRALAIREKSLGPEHPNVATSLNNLAVLYTKLGDYAKAEPLHQRALAVREKSLGPEHLDVAVSLNNLALLYVALGDYAKAEPLLQRALAILEKSLGSKHPNVANSLNALAILYRNLGDYAKAEPLHQRALAIQEKSLGPEHPNVAESLIYLANLYHDRGDHVKAESFYQRALDIFEKALGPEHPYVASSINSLAVLYRDKGDYAKAEPLLQRALAILEKSLGPEHPDVVGVLDALAMLDATKGDFAQAVTVQARADSVGERNLARNLAIGSERRKLAYLALFSKQTDFTLSLHSQALPHDPQALDLAFTTLLRRKGRGLDVMANTIGALRRRATPEDQALFDQLAEARSKLAALTLKELGTGKPETYRARLKSLEDKVEELESALSARSPEFRAQAQPVTLAAVQSALPAGSALVEFAVYTPQDPRNNKNKLPPRYLAYLLAAQGQPKWTDLGKARPIDRAITSWRRALRDPRRTDVRRLARVVNEKVMRPVLGLAQSRSVKTRRLLIAPDSLLNLVPFAALVDRQGRYLVEGYSISYLTSGRDLLRSPVRRPGNQDTVIVADPDYDAAVDLIAARSQDVGLPPALFGAWRIRLPGVVAKSLDGVLPAGLPQSAGSNLNLARIYFPPLKGTAGEARALKTILPQATVFTRGQATEAALKQLHSPGILHVATHGFFLRDQVIRMIGTRDLILDTVQSGMASDQLIENPLLRSGLAMAGANQRLGRADQGDDGVLTAYEAAGLDLWGTKLVVLSACDTGVGEVKNGEGVFGLRRALSLAGSETQLMSLWPVSDLGTRDLMTEYYKSLERGEGRGDGLRHVQLEMLKRKGRRHPFYWASFILSGEWANLEGKR
jgi:CHAT domain-containing protein/Tfp pilus assembly protein PilF